MDTDNSKGTDMDNTNRIPAYVNPDGKIHSAKRNANGILESQCTLPGSWRNTIRLTRATEGTAVTCGKCLGAQKADHFATRNL